MKPRFQFADTALPGLRVVERVQIGDARGYLERIFCSADLREVGWKEPVAQINRTFTAGAGSVRGLHFQHPPYAEMKLVVCLRGHVFDVAVDLRTGSETFLRWHAEELSASNGRAMLIPQGFAHGFQALTGEVEMLYLHSAAYEAAAEGGVHPEDPRLSVAWPRPISNLSARDLGHPLLEPAFEGIRL